MIRRVAPTLLALAAGVAVAASAAEPEPAGYRGAPYQGPVPETLAGAEVVDDAAARALWETGDAAFIDVLPRPPKPANLPEGTVWRDPPHDTIPGATWLPNTGFDALDPASLDYFLAGLHEATAGDAGAPLVVFCKRDCWMSWNAARRALEHGYTTVHWYPGGIDGWAASGWKLAPVEPAAPTR